jgi:uncharacterized protein (DUF3820 family)
MEAVNFEQFDANILQELASMKMPFGKYKGRFARTISRLVL